MQYSLTSREIFRRKFSKVITNQMQYSVLS